MTALHRLFGIVLTPSARAEDGYIWALIGIVHAMLGAALQYWLGVSEAAVRLLAARQVLAAQYGLTLP